MPGHSARLLPARPALVLVLGAGAHAAGARGEQAAPCFEEGVAYDDGALAPNAGYKSSALQCQGSCQASPWCAFFTYRQATSGCWNHDVKQVPRTQVGAVSGPKHCPVVTTPPPTTTPAPTLAPTLPPGVAGFTTALPSAPSATGPASWWDSLRNFKGPRAWVFSSAKHIAIFVGSLAAIVLLVVCCCVCQGLDKNAEEARLERKKEQKRERRNKEMPPSPTGARELVVGPGVEATPTPSFMEREPLLQRPLVPGLTPPKLPPALLPPIQQVGPEPLMGPLVAPLPPLRVPSISAAPGGGEAQASSFVVTGAGQGSFRYA